MLATSGQAGPTPIPESVYEPLRQEAGTWDADVTFYADDKPSGKATGVQVNTPLVNGHWMVNQFNIPASDKFPAYEGHGVWRYDPVAKTYVDTWVDTNDQTVRTDCGYWHAPENTMVWSSKQSDGDGHFVDYRMTEEFKGDTRIFTVYQLGLFKPNQHPLLKIVFTEPQDLGREIERGESRSVLRVPRELRNFLSRSHRLARSNAERVRSPPS